MYKRWGLLSKISISPSNEKEVKEKLQEILSSAEFNESESKRNLLTSLRERFVDFLKDIFEKLNVSKNFGSLFYDGNIPFGTLSIIRLVILLLLIGVIVLILYIIIKNLRNSKEIKYSEDLMLLNTIKDPEFLLGKVNEYLKAGDYNQALRYLYMSVLISLNNLDVIKINKSKTNKQYLMEINSERPQIYNLMAQFTQDFNVFWYGNKRIEKSHFNTWFSKYNALCKGEVPDA